MSRYLLSLLFLRRELRRHTIASIKLVGLIIAVMFILSACSGSHSSSCGDSVFTVDELLSMSETLHGREVRVAGRLVLEWEGDRIETLDLPKSRDEVFKSGRWVDLDISGYPEFEGKERLNEYWNNFYRWYSMNGECVVVTGYVDKAGAVMVYPGRWTSVMTISDISLC